MLRHITKVSITKNSRLFLLQTPKFFRKFSGLLTKYYETEIPLSERYLLFELQQQWQKEKPFAGKHILVNMHMTLLTLAVIDLLQSAGAIVDTTATKDLAKHDNTIKPLKKSGFNFYDSADIPLHKRKAYYDIVYDCGAGMLTLVKPKIGMVELTHTPPSIYQDIQFPVITVDNSKTKELETGFGTGDSLTRVITHITKDSLERTLQYFLNIPHKNPQAQHLFLIGLLGSMDMNNLFVNKKYMLFGYGKVGKGIAMALRNAGVLERDLFIVEISTDAYLKVKEDGFAGFLLDTSNNIDEAKSAIKEKLPDMHTVITATGVKDAISTFFDAKDFANIPMLINMGTYDEYGHKFNESQIINQKKPANFLLPRPTQVKYLDAIFDIFLRAGIELSEKKLNNGLHNISKEVDRSVLGKWMKKHNSSGKLWSYEGDAIEYRKFSKSILYNQDANYRRNLFNDFKRSKKIGITHHSCGADIQIP